MAAVFAARSERASGAGLVAVKIMSTILADDPASQRMFLREAAIALRLQHPNVIRVYDVGSADGELFLAMEFIHGQALAAVVRSCPAPLPLSVVLRVVCDVARGLHAAHETTDAASALLGVVHQDVSPHNVMLGYDGSVKLVDFGVARLSSLDGSRTMNVRGKPAYLAPEQLGKGPIDRRTDVFALGIVLHELLTGERLFARDTVSDSYAAVIASEPVADVRDKNPAVPEPLAAAVARALTRDPVGRFRTADELRIALESAAAQAGIAMMTAEKLGAWLRAGVPPSQSVAELEREIVHGAPPQGAADVADLPTIIPGRAPHSGVVANEKPPLVANGSRHVAGEVDAPAARSRRGWAFGLAAAVATAAVAITVVRSARVRAISPDTASPTADVEASAPADAHHPPAVDALPVAPAAEAPARSVETLGGTAETARRTGSAAKTEVGAAARKGEAPATASSSAAPPVPTSSAPGDAASARIGVWSNISGRVRIDGTLRGDSPLPAVSVSPGTHAVSITTPSGEQAQSVTVKPGEQAKVRFVF
jgi:serine/threonine-protein kinase